MGPRVVDEEHHVLEVLAILVQVRHQVLDEFEEVACLDGGLLHLGEQELRPVVGDDAVQLGLPGVVQSVGLLVLSAPFVVLGMGVVDSELVDGDDPLTGVEGQDQEAAPQQLLGDVVWLDDPPVALRASSPPVVQVRLQDVLHRGIRELLQPRPGLLQLVVDPPHGELVVRALGHDPLDSLGLLPEVCGMSLQRAAQVPGVQAIGFQIFLDLVRPHPGYPNDVRSFSGFHEFFRKEHCDTVALLCSFEALSQFFWNRDGSITEVIGLDYLILHYPLLELLHHCWNLPMKVRPGIDNCANRREFLSANYGSNLSVSPNPEDCLPE